MAVMKNTLIIIFILFSFNAQAEIHEGFVYLKDAAPSVVQDIRYFTHHNFVGAPVDGYEAPECMLAERAANALSLVQEELVSQGYSLKVYDCYRPQKAADHFVRWAKDAADTKTKAEFYPNEVKKNLFRRGYIASRSGHSRGSTVDLTIVPLNTPEQEEYIPHKNLRSCENSADKRFGDNSIDMGTGFDCFSELSSTEHPSIKGKQAANRHLLKNVMQKFGFKNYSREWWHYTLKDEDYKEKYFDFNIQ
jgi:D-alanyl-D-alanine dipeptidase